MTTPIELSWSGCYRKGWSGLIVPASFAHPAKISFGLAEKIYAFLFEIGAVNVGDSTLDPFGGIAGTGLSAMRRGLHWTGLELEPRFVELGNQNIALWNERYAGKLPNFGTAKLLQGDSRRLAEIVGAARCAVSSPPFAGTDPNEYRPSKANGKYEFNIGSAMGNYGSSPNNLGNLREGDFAAAISSPPYSGIAVGAGGLNTKPAKNGQQGGRNPHSPSQDTDQHYGATDGQLATMAEGDYRAVVSSPPFGQSGNGDDRKNGGIKDPTFRIGSRSNLDGTAYSLNPYNLGNLPQRDFSVAVSSPPYEGARIGESSGAANVGHGENYGNGAGQLGNMAGGDFRAAVSSPPYEASISNHTPDVRDDRKFSLKFSQTDLASRSYSIDTDNLGNESGETFWTAARTIVEQTHQVLAPGGVAVWVCKRFVRGGAIVEFSQQWAQLCEAVGFETTHWIRALLVEENGIQLATDGKHKRLKTERKSFFRRLHEKKYPATAINWEDVIVMKKI